MRDVDGWRHGAYQSDTTLVNLEYPKQGWNQGRAEAEQEIVLKYKSKRRNMRYSK